MEVEVTVLCQIVQAKQRSVDVREAVEILLCIVKVNGFDVRIVEEAGNFEISHRTDQIRRNKAVLHQVFDKGECVLGIAGTPTIEENVAVQLFSLLTGKSKEKLMNGVFVTDTIAGSIGQECVKVSCVHYILLSGIRTCSWIFG